MATARRRRRRRKERRLFLTIFTFLVVVGAIIASITVFLKVADIEVTGLTKYEKTDIIATSGIKIGDNMFAINKFDVAEKILNEYPYIETIKIRRKLPDTFTFEITERVPVAFIETEGKRWLLDSKAFVVEMISVDEPLTLPKIIGGTAVVPQAGKDLVFTQTEQLEALKKALLALETSGISEKIKRIEVEKFYEIKMVYEDRFLVNFGDSENFPRKMEMLKAVIAQLSDYERGTINVSAVKKASFLPDVGIKLTDEEILPTEESEIPTATESEETLLPEEENGEASEETSEETSEATVETSEPANGSSGEATEPPEEKTPVPESASTEAPSSDVTETTPEESTPSDSSETNPEVPVDTGELQAPAEETVGPEASEISAAE